ncbi:hypothetical protein G7Y89_g1494 [Cudoniella acicularis]|uniref:Dipeptidase n=1 Tax=Cudoniella acicularis TaxID=354080 RepID=A0A8H4W9H5_9HELO|nr:hypothetical protein G7Y89_g1494 [Cudoniella acicularis]
MQTVRIALPEARISETPRSTGACQFQVQVFKARECGIVTQGAQGKKNEEGNMDQDEASREAIEILGLTPLIDGHNDFPHLIRGFYDNKIQNSRFDEESSLVGHVDLKRLREGRSGGVFLSAYVDCPLQNKQNDFRDEIHLETIHDTLQQIDLIHRLIDKNSSTLALASNSSDIMRIFETENKIACLIGVEGLHQIGNSASILRMYHRLGVRYVTLTHNANNMYADSATVPGFHGGLSDAGREMVREMNRIGMTIDLSHTSAQTAEQVLDLSSAPVAFTHSSTDAACPNPRNVTDVCLDKLQKNNGIIMISFIPGLTHSKPEEASIQHVVDHILYVASRIGFDHIGIGTDFDGMEKGVQGLEDVSKFPDLVALLLEKGVEKDNVQKIVGLNVIRVLKDVENFALQERNKNVAGESEALPLLEDDIKQLWNDGIRSYVRQVYPDRG